MKERFKATNPKAMMCRFHTQTGGSTLTAQQIDNNVVRVTLQALAAALGGTQSLHTNARDEALALPTEESARLALRTQQVIAHESGITAHVDPLAGSEVVEALTDDLEEEVWKYLGQVDDMGGATQAIEMGFFQNEIARSAYQYQQEIEREERIVVGLNRFQADDSVAPEILQLDQAATRRQLDRLEKVKAERDSSEVRNCLADLKAAAEGPEENLLPHILRSVKAYATLGEISDTLRSVFGEYKDQGH
jgi:methylmalonyl-CoA mutase N-terminal domain/subunit